MLLTHSDLLSRRIHNCTPILSVGACDLRHIAARARPGRRSWQSGGPGERAGPIPRESGSRPERSREGRPYRLAEGTGWRWRTSSGDRLMSLPASGEPRAPRAKRAALSRRPAAGRSRAAILPAVAQPPHRRSRDWPRKAPRSARETDEHLRPAQVPQRRHKGGVYPGPGPQGRGLFHGPPSISKHHRRCRRTRALFANLASSWLVRRATAGATTPRTGELVPACTSRNGEMG